MFDLVVKYCSPLKHIPFLPHFFDALAGGLTTVLNSRIPGYIDKVEAEVSKWDGIVLSQHKYGGLQFNYGKKEIGHLHSNGLLDIHFPAAVRDELINAGKAEEHHVFKNSGWISFYIKEEGDVITALELLRIAYNLRAKTPV